MKRGGSRAGLVAVLLAAGLVIPSLPADAAEEDAPESDSSEAPGGSGWQELGLDGPRFRWRAGASMLAAASDRFGGENRFGWFTQIAPRLALERPPARWSGWLFYEPTFRTRAPKPADGNSPNSLSHQGAAGVSVGDASGTRLAFEARQRYTVDVVRAEQEGLSEHRESSVTGTVGYVLPEHGSAGASVSGTVIRFPGSALRAADHQRVDAVVQLNVKAWSRATGGVRWVAGAANYPRPPEGGDRDVRSGSVAATFSARVMPALSVRAGAGPSWRRDPETTRGMTGWAGMTVETGDRLRASIDAGTDLEDSLWRENRNVRVSTLDSRLTGSLRKDLQLSVLIGAKMLAYPVPEQAEGEQPPIPRRDAAWTGGVELSSRPGERLQMAASYTHAQRRSTFPGLSWKENRWIVSALLTW